MNNDLRVVLHVDAFDDPYLLPRLLGQISRKGGRIEMVNSFPISGSRQRCVLTVLGCQPDFLRRQLQKVDGVEKCSMEDKNESSVL